MGTVSRLSYRWDHAALAKAAGLAEKLGLPAANLDVPSIRRLAERRTGLTDLGEGSEGLLRRLDKVAEFVKRSPMTAIGRIANRASSAASLENRLRLVQWQKDNPELASRPIAPPIVIVGMPRTGTTALHQLLALAPAHRGLRFWELISPIPLSADPVKDRKLRRRLPSSIVRGAYYFAPEQRAVHHLDVDTYEECWPLLFNSFGALNIDLMQGVREWGDWLLAEADMNEVYRAYRSQLRVLSSTGSGRLVVKCPEHLWFLEALLSVFPDANIVWTHRDPLPTIASYTSLAILSHRTMYGVVRPAELAAHLQARFVEAVTRGMAVRDAHIAAGGRAKFVDISMSEVRDQPAATARRVMDAFDLEVTPEHERGMSDWIGRPRPDAAGRHRYDLDAFELDAEQIRAQFAAYTERFLG